MMSTLVMRPTDHRPRRAARPWLATMMLTLVALAWGSAVRGAPRPPRRVVLIVDRPKDAFAERIRSEVAGLGLTVVVLEPWRAREPIGPLEEAARAQHAVAAIHMLPSRKGVEVWMADETSGRSLLRQLIVDESPGGPNESLIALQTAELMRTSLLSQARPPATPGLSGATWSSPGADDAAPSRSPAVDVAARAEAPPALAPKAAVQAAMGVLASPGTGTPAFQAWLSFERWLLPRLSVALDVTAPLYATTVSGPEGSARIGAYAAGAAVLVHLEPSASPLFASAGLGFAALRVTASGEAAAPLVARDVSAIVAAGYLRADGGVDVTSRVRLGLRGMAGTTVQRVALRFAGNGAGSWGRPLVAGLLLAELRWP